MSTNPAPTVGLISDVLQCQYELTTLDSGAAVYAFTSFPQHYVCPYCFEQALLHVLQYRRVGARCFTCPGCQTSFPVQHSTGCVALV
jgi:transposase-like protein